MAMVLHLVLRSRPQEHSACRTDALYLLDNDARLWIVQRQDNGKLVQSRRVC